MIADFENRRLAIPHLCVAQFGQDIDGEPPRSMVHKRTAIYSSCFSRRRRGGSRTCAG